MAHNLDSDRIPVAAGDPDAVFYAGSVDPGVWNGWIMPAFPHAEVERIAAWLAREAEGNTWGDWSKLTYDAESGAWTLTTSDYPDEPETFAPDEAGLFAIGAGAWTWEFADEADSAEHVARYRAARDAREGGAL